MINRITIGQNNYSNKYKSHINFTGDNENTKASIFYINDFHGKAMNMERTLTAVNEFDEFVPSQGVDKLKLSSGDIMLGADLKTNKIALNFLKFAGITASAVGNHECDMETWNFKELMKNATFNLMSCNLKSSTQNPLTDIIKSSIVEEHNGNKYGIIGTTPSDLSTRIMSGKVLQEFSVDPITLDNTIKSVQAEVDKLRSLGVNKIILLSHSGYIDEQVIAQQTDGIDVILGGHSHDVIEGVNEGKNLFYSKSGEPVVITQAGRDGKKFGILNLEFDDKGVIKKVQNNLGNTRSYSRNALARNIFESILGKPEVIGEIGQISPPPYNDLLSPNAIAYYGIDAIKEKTGADIALVGAANIRGYFEKGKIDTRGVAEVSPFKNKILTMNYSEKDIVDAIKFSAKSMVNPEDKPGLLFLSGMRYTVSKSTGEVSNLYYKKPDGGEEKIDLNNPREDRIYKVALNEYYCSGSEELPMLDKVNKNAKLYNFDINDCIEEKIRKTPYPIDILDDDRVKVID